MRAKFGSDPTAGSKIWSFKFISRCPLLLMFSRGFKDIITKTAIFKEFPGLENKFQNSRGFKEIRDSWEPCNLYFLAGMATLRVTLTHMHEHNITRKL